MLKIIASLAVSILIGVGTLSAETIINTINLGGSGYYPVNADFDGDGKIDPAVYSEESGNWHVAMSSTNYAIGTIALGARGYSPAAADYDGDGKADPAVYNETSGEWFIRLSGSGYTLSTGDFGGPGYMPRPADYDGDMIAEPCAYNYMNGNWFVLQITEPEVTDTNVLAAMFALAVTDAHQPTVAKVSRALTAISTNTPGLVWSNGLVLVASFTRAYDYAERIGQAYTNGFGDTWVTVVPDLRSYFRSYQGTNQLLRIKQALGMPYYLANDMIAEFWVNPQLLFRPSADPEITDHESQPDFSYTNSGFVAVSPAYVGWYESQVVSNSWPWTRLGYTYDWGNSRSHVGLSEFVIPQGSTFLVNSITNALEYLATP